mgnify:CR=1 FL=1
MTDTATPKSDKANSVVPKTKGAGRSKPAESGGAPETPKASYERDGNQLLTALKLLRYLWPEGKPRLRLLFVLTGGAILMGQLFLAVTPMVFATAVDAVSGEGNFTNVGIALVIGLVVAFGLARLASQASQELSSALFIFVGQNGIRTVALETFQHLHKLSLRFHLDRQTGGLSRAIERGTKGIEFVLRMMTFNLIPTGFAILIVSTILLLNFGAVYAIITFVTVVGYIIYTIAVTEWRLKYRRLMNETDSEATTKAVDSLLNYETVKYFSNENHEASRYDRALKGYEKAAVNSQLSLSLLNLGQGIIIAGGLILLLGLAVPRVMAGDMTVGDFVAIQAYLIQLYLPLNFLGFAYREIKQGLIDMEYMFNLLDVEREVPDREGAHQLNVEGGRLAFNNVDFGYNDDRQILHKLDFDLAPGKTLAIVGPSGSGKSTIGRMLFRFYDVWDGNIEIDGQDLRDVTQHSLRENIGIVPQDTVLFNDTIAYNIAYGRPDASRDDVVEAAKLAQIHDFIMDLPEGYDTRVGERGLKLSGGERQRVSIARTILKNPSILLFDEATSALDTDTESAIQASLAAVSKDRTTLVIAHRLSTVVDADQIIVLDKGKIVEKGSHHALLEQDGVYAHMWHSQQEADD